MTHAQSTRSKSIGYSGLAAMILVLLLSPMRAHADTTSTPLGFHFDSIVLRGPDAGVRLEGYLSITPGTGTHVAGTLSTYAGTIMSSISSYAPITATGTLDKQTANLSFDLSNLISGSDAPATKAGAMLRTLANPHFAHLTAHAALRGTGKSLQSGTFAGTLDGPAPSDSGSWTAVPAVSHSFALNAVSTSGHKFSLSGQAAVVFAADGTIQGLYISDDGTSAYAIRGVTNNNQMSLVLEMANGEFLYGTGAADHIDTYQFFHGVFSGPDTTTTGKWSAAFTD